MGVDVIVLEMGRLACAGRPAPFDLCMAAREVRYLINEFGPEML